MNAHDDNDTSSDAPQVLEIIGRTHDATELDVRLWPELCQASCSLLKDGFTPEQVAQRLIEEYGIPQIR
jgi:hypothetical protein